jgi:hypothetical protein
LSRAEWFLISIAVHFLPRVTSLVFENAVDHELYQLPIPPVREPAALRTIIVHLASCNHGSWKLYPRSFVLIVWHSISGSKTWQIHKPLTICHSKWFQKAFTSGLEVRKLNGNGSGSLRSSTGSRERSKTLNDKSKYADAVDRMVSYFYEAGYHASRYDTSKALLHAQVAILADKYDCQSLYILAKRSFEESVQAVESNEWRVIAAFVYDFTTMEALAHREIRNVVITAVASRCYMLRSTLKNETVVNLLGSNADLATDLLLGRRYGFLANNVGEYNFTCDYCRYNHSGLKNCPNVSSVNANGARVCPNCLNGSGSKVAHYTSSVELYPSFCCTLCDGFHTHSLEPETYAV